MTRLHLATTALLLSLGGCVTGPNHVPPEMPMPEKFAEGGTKSNGLIVADRWWTAFADKQLDNLVGQGFDHNFDILQANESINSAAANVTVAGAGALPSLNVSASHTVSGEMGTQRTTIGATNTTGGSASVSWLLDIFGQYRRSKEAALASLDAAYASADDTRLSFLKDLTSTYIDARYYQQRLALSYANLKSRRETYSLTQMEFRVGAASQLDIAQAEGLVQSTLADIPGLKNNFNKSAHHIATLVGLPASALTAELEKARGQPVYGGDIQAGIPADLIRNRPDIRKAERELAEAIANIGVAESKLYPSLTLSGSISPSWVNPAGTSGGGLTSWSFGPSLSLPIFDGGSLRANVDISKSDAKGQYLAWREAVLNGIEEVENALSSVRRDAKTVKAQQRQVETAEESLRLSTGSYKEGASSLLDVLDAQRSVSSAQSDLAASVQQVAKDYVDLYVAVGAGYGQPDAPAPKPSVSQRQASLVTVRQAQRARNGLAN